MVVPPGTVLLHKVKIMGAARYCTSAAPCFSITFYSVAISMRMYKKLRIGSRNSSLYPSVPIILDFIGTANTSNYGNISGNTVNHTSGSSSYVAAYSMSHAIPKDGNWWYWEASYTGGSAWAVAGLQTSSQAAAGTMPAFIGSGSNTANLSSYRGIAVRWYSNQFYACLVQASGTSGVATAQGTSIVNVYPGVGITGALGNSVTVKPSLTQMLSLPNISAFNAGAVYQATTHALLP